MSTFDYTYDSTTYPAATGTGTPTGQNVMGLRTLTSRAIAIGGAAGSEGYGRQNDTYDVFDLRAGTVVLAAYVTIEELPNETCDVILGVSGDTNGYIEAQELYTSRTAGQSLPGIGTALGTTAAADEPGTTLLVSATIANAGAALTSGRLRFTLVCAGGTGAGN